MAQAEDTELRDLVIEALEKNGSLAKIRALLRANIFLAFEDECDNLKINDTLVKVLQLPEDEKNKIDLRLTLDNSDTDTSSDSTRGQTRSEYIPSKHIDAMNSKMKENQNISEQSHQQQELQSNYNYVAKNSVSENCLRDLKIVNNSSTESTSYAELKPFNMLDTVLLNTSGLPFHEVKHEKKKLSPHNSNSTASKIESLSTNHTLNSTSASKKDNISHQDSKASVNNSSEKYDDYSYDFTSPPISERKDGPDKQSPRSGQLNLIANKSNNTSIESNQHNSPSSQSSISLSDVADLISDRSSKKYSPNSVSNLHKLSNRSLIKDHVKMLSDDSGDFSESPIPSLSNLSLDIHSD
ncbi:jg6627 [Pararge aegeria aegeria]|uniref:Jg6627 protein n=1 Tax=Pararge aegeria aegeria TaxID=348720 RepID=A0A8S4RM24_9NEOP|nr:jg6627 [Pararge aegeria aegeria]